MYTINCKGKLLVLHKPAVMGVINLTPDSFYEGHLHKGLAAVTAMAGSMLQQGAAIIDIGGQSTRPGSTPLTDAEEMNRVLPAIDSILQAYPEAILSIDTYHSKVAAAAVTAGARIINDISAGHMDPEMLATAGALKVPYIAMHLKGTPATMQQQPHYDNLLQEVLDYFIQTIQRCTEAGISDLVIDPGFGFGKTIAHNFHLLKNLSLLQMLEKPILAGLSRKSTIYKTLGVTAQEALNGTTVLNSLALMNGAAILRVHDVKEAMEAITLTQAVLHS